jgi:RNA polymerase sigma-70 factor (ECF subfamily)
MSQFRAKGRLVDMIDRDDPRLPFMAPEADTQQWPLEPYRGYLLALARLRLGLRLRGGIGASDAVQNALLKAHQHRGQFRGQTEVEWRAYLRRILANTLADAFRGLPDEKVIQETLDQSSAQLKQWEAKQSSPSQQAQRDELLLRLADALTRLSKDERTALELRYFENPAWSLVDIGRHLNRPSAKAVAGLLSRGLEKLRGLLRDCQ